MAAIEIESGFAGGGVIDASVTNRSYFSVPFLRDHRGTRSRFALRGVVVIAGHVCTRSEEATVAASGGGPAPVAAGAGLTDVRGSFACGSNAVRSPVVSVTFGRAYDAVPSVVLTPVDAKTQALGLSVAASEMGFAVRVTDRTEASAPVRSGVTSEAYQAIYIVLA